ncbi:response regulator [Flavobacterium psychrophilum]|uniref:response regulator n=1 Tax=Flavobacterium psychrophilum TaxID=96345 RepID=UPI00090B97B8|nr:response regulator [Flavobacterium psychrophilum]EKT2072607.1 response regulator transcription factor [Flavobacterium psychrophilum]EKT4492120.1 response regulator transcription factor [Flavobacterium psychrophilum]SHH93231.1 Probable two-component system response regulatory protein [Flavobacterium psychrophilum]
MQTLSQNLFLLDDKPLSSNRIVDFLEKKFTNSLSISTFVNGETLLKKVDADTAIVIIDYDLKGERADVLVLEIRKINPNTEIIILSTDDDIAKAIDVFRNGAKSFILKGEKAPRELFFVIYKILNYPVKILVERFGINKILAIFIAYFFIIGIIVYVGMNLLKY